MKYELLKRTAIALFVGSVISTYSVAESGKISADSSLKDVADAINKNDENISKIKTDVSDLAKSLKGDAQNPGLLDALEEASKGIDENKEALAKKADKEDVNKIKKDVSDLAKALKGDDKNPGLLDALEETSKGIDENKEALALKADKADVDAIDAEVGVIGKNVKTIGEDLDSTIKDVESLQGDMQKASEAVNSLSDNLKELNDAQNTLNESFKDQLNAANEALDKHESDIKEIKNLKGYDSLTEVENKVKEGVSGKADKQALEDLKKEVKDNEDEIGKLSDFVNNVDSDVDELAKQHNELSDKHNTLVDKHNELVKEVKEFADETNNKLNDKADKQALKDLSEGIRDNVLPAIEANRSDIDKNASNITDTRNKQVLQNARLDNHGERITAVEEGLTAKADQDYVDGLEQDVKINTQDIKDLSVGIRDHVLPAIEANRSDIDKNASHITDIRNKQALQNARLDNHGERIEANKAAIGDLARATNEAVTNLGNAVSGLDEDLAGTQDAVAENRKDIDKNASRITDTRNKQVLQNARLDNHGERIDANKVAIATNVDKIATNKAAIATNADKIATNVDKIATNADKIATKADKNSVYSKSETDEKFALKADNSVVRAQATDISNLRTDVNAHKVDIDKLRTDVNVHTKRLDHLDNRVNKLDKDLKRGLAAQAALTGLFQPYTVGKANFTAAVGGYKSQTAVAVGTGYRYNQNIATKAGVAFTQGGGVTYNAGVNFEW